MQAVVYTRISDDPTGRAAGVQRQTAECMTLAESRGAAVVEQVVDNDLSATSGKRRPGYDRVLELVRSGSVDTVIVWHTDRLYRLPRDLEPLIELAERRRLRFLTVTASEIDLNTPSGRMVARMLAAASAQEVEHKAERQRSASDQRAARGEPIARPGYGFQRSANSLVSVPHEAAVLREAAARVLAGESLRSIATDFNTRRIPSPSGVAPWRGVTLRQTLRRPSLAGLRVHRGKVVGLAVGEAVLDRDTHDRLVALFDDPRRSSSSRVGHPPKHLLSGLALCGRCGGRIKRLPAWRPKPGQDSKPTSAAYACGECFKVRRKQAPVDELVAEVVIRRLEQPDAADLLARGDHGVVRETRDAIAAVEARLASAADAFADGAIDGAQLRRITDRLRTDRARLQVTLNAAFPPAIPSDAIGARSRTTWESSSIDVRRALVEALLVVTILPSPSRGAFDPSSIDFAWRSS